MVVSILYSWISKNYLFIFHFSQPVKPTPIRAKSEMSTLVGAGSNSASSISSSSNSSSQQQLHHHQQQQLPIAAPMASVAASASSKAPSLTSSTPSKTSSLATLSAAAAGINSSIAAAVAAANSQTPDNTMSSSSSSLADVTPIRPFQHPIAFAAVAKSGARKLVLYNSFVSFLAELDVITWHFQGKFKKKKIF